MTYRMRVGDVLFTGQTVKSPEQAAAYNRISERIEQFERERGKAPDELLNGRHNLFQAIASA